MEPQTDSEDCHLPTPEEIRQTCREIQAEWTPKERRLRGGIRGKSKPWTVPEMKYRLK